LLSVFFVSLMAPRAPVSPVFPYTTLFRSPAAEGGYRLHRRRHRGNGRCLRIGRRRDRESVHHRRFGESHCGLLCQCEEVKRNALDRKSTRLNSSHVKISYAVFCLQKKNHV